jgi:ribA/ribD-fused uncharacterized protein
MADISFTKVALPYGWLGNMAPYPIIYEGKEWRTVEALFQALRFEDPEIIEAIRNEKSPMGAKMKAKSFKSSYSISPLSQQDIENMKLCLQLKFSQHSDLRNKLLKTGEHTIIEDIGSRRGARHEFWGAYKNEKNEWVGNNLMGKLLMELRASYTRANYTGNSN